jgi:hypothetical protein
MPTVDDWDIVACRATVQTDSLTVLMDLSSVDQAVSEAVFSVLGTSDTAREPELEQQDAHRFGENCRLSFVQLLKTNPKHALQFATLVSALLHEARHIHDLKATRIGAELLLADLESYQSASRLIVLLKSWQEGAAGRRIPLPLSSETALSKLASDEIRDLVNKADRLRRSTRRYWNARSQFRAFPGHSIRDLYECMGFNIQLEWLASTFGPEVADAIVVKSVGDVAINSPYLKPMFTLATFCGAAGVGFDPEPHDVNALIIDSLNVFGLEDGFSCEGATADHPGAWFERICLQYAELGLRSDCPASDRAGYAVGFALQKEVKGLLSERLSVANRCIQSMQDRLMRQLVQGAREKSNGDDSLLLASEVAIEFRDMWRLLHVSPEYNSARGYAKLFWAGDLHSVYLRIKSRHGIRELRTPSAIPGNHVGGARHASLCGQIMRLLLDGRDLARSNFYEEHVFERLRSNEVNPSEYFPLGAPGLRFQLVS